MATTSLQVYYRPIRIGFLIRENNLNDLKYATSINCSIWGGVYNPLIPISNNEKLVDNLIHLFKCDVLYPVCDQKDVIDVFNKYSWLKWPNNFRKPGLLIKNDNHNEKNELCVTDISAIVDYYWEKIFRHSKKQSNCVHFTWDSDDPLDNIFSDYVIM